MAGKKSSRDSLGRDDLKQLVERYEVQQVRSIRASMFAIVGVGLIVSAIGAGLAFGWNYYNESIATVQQTRAGVLDLQKEFVTFRQAANLRDERAQQEVADMKKRLDEVETLERRTATRISTLEKDIADLKAQQPAFKSLLNSTSGISKNGNTTVISAGGFSFTFGDNGIFSIAGPRGGCFASNDSTIRPSC